LPSASVVHAPKSRVDEARVALERGVGEILEKLGEVKEYVSKSAGSISGEVENAIKAKVAELIDSFKVFSQHISEILDDFSRREEAALAGLREEASSATTSVEGAIASVTEETGYMLSSAIEKCLEEVSVSSRSMGDEAVKSVKEHSRSAAVSVESSLNSYLSELKGKLAGLERDAVGALDLAFTSANESISRVSSNVESTISDLVSQLQEMQRRLMDAKSSLQSALTDVQSKISQESERAKKRAGEAFNIMSSSAEAASSRVSEEVKLSLKRMGEAIASRVEEEIGRTITKLESSLKSAGKEFEAALAKLSDTVKRHLEDVQRRITEQVSKASEDEKAVVLRVKSEVEDELSKVQASLDKLRSEASNKITSVVSPLSQEIGRELDSAKSKVESIVEAVRSIAFTEIVGVGLVAGYSNVKDYMRQVVKSAKSSLLLVAPNIEVEDVEALLSASPRVTLQVAASGDPATLRKIASRPNTSLRVLEEGNMMGVMRDREEVLLAWLPPKAEQTVAICSTLEGYIEEFSRPLKETWFKAKKFE